MSIDTKKVSNPLTIIAIFAGIAELAGSVVLPLVAEQYQNIFIWYVMGFPTLLVIIFFLTLNFNPRVLYSPSDYSNEDNFVTMIRKGQKVEKSLDLLGKKVVETKTNFSRITFKPEDKKIADDINKDFENISRLIHKNKEETKNLLSFDEVFSGYKKNSIYNKAVNIIYSRETISENDLRILLNVSQLKLKRIINNLEINNLIDISKENGKSIIKSKF